MNQERKTKSEKRKTAERIRLLRAFRFSFFVFLFSFLPFLPGCQILGVAAYKLHGPAKVPAQYVPAQQPMLVLVENYQHQSSVNAHADLLGRMIIKELEAKKVAPLVSLDKLQELRDARPAEFASMSMAAIGRAVGASQILYVQLERSDVTPISGGDALTGQTSATVKVVDVATGNTLWPADIAAEAGYPLGAGTKLGASNGGTVQDVRQRMYAKLSHDIARLFYKWQPEYQEPEGFES